MTNCRMTESYRGLFQYGVWIVLGLCVLPGMSSRVYAQGETKLRAQDGAENDAFGFSVSLSGGRALVGAFQADNESGAAYIFANRGSRWAQEAKLTVGNPNANDRFGGDVSLDGDLALVGATGRDDAANFAGAVYVFRREDTAWVEEAQLLASDAAAEDLFGGSVWLDGDQAIVGARGNDDEAGAAYIFRRVDSVWVEEARLTASDAAANDWFGYSVSIDGDRALVGAYLNDDDGGGSGSAYVFRRDGSTWTEEAKLTASDAEGGDRFGEAVSLDGDRALIGAWGFAGSSGAAYVFRRDGSTWTQEAKLTASDAAINDRFGDAVSLLGDRALVGAWGDATAGPVTGAAYLFRRDGTSWSQDSKIISSDATSRNGFGIAVSLDGEAMLVGAFGNDDVGAAYVFGQTIPVGVDEQAAVPRVAALYGNYPNPFNPSTEIRFDLPQATHTRLVVYNAMGREVARLFDEPLRAGAHTVTWEATGLPSGAYLYRLTTGTFSETKVMVLLR